MILVTSRDHLAAAMSRVGGIIAKSQTVPILANVLLSADNGRLTIRASNADMEATESIPAEIGETGEVTVSADRLSELSRNLPAGGQIGMKLEKDWLHVTCGRTRVKFATLPASSFPQLWAETWDTQFDVSAPELASLLAHVDYAQHPGPADWNMQGVRLENKDGRLRAVATNRAMIAVCDGPEVPDFAAITVPTRMVGEMTKFLTDGDVSLGISDGKVSLWNSEMSITSKLIDRSMGFPGYERVIVPESPNHATLPTEDAVAGIRRAMIAGQNMGAKGMTVRLVFSENSVAMTARNAEADAFDEIEIEFEGDEVSLPLNPAFVLDALNHIGTEFVNVRFGGKGHPTYWTPHEGADCLVAIMPQAV